MHDKTEFTLVRGPIAQLTLNCPRGLHLLHSQLIQELIQTLDVLKQDPELRVLIVTGGEAKSFSAGADMRELLELQDTSNYVLLGQALTEVLYHFPVPVIAAINGHALGAGFSLAMACELRFMACEAKIGQLAVRNALTPPFGNIQHLLQAIGPLKTREILYTGEIFSAERALELNLVNRAVPRSELLEEAQKMAQTICRAPKSVVSLVKNAINRTLEEGFSVGYLAQEEALIQTLESDLSRDILRGFLEKR